MAGNELRLENCNLSLDYARTAISAPSVITKPAIRDNNCSIVWLAHLHHRRRRRRRYHEKGRSYRAAWNRLRRSFPSGERRHHLQRNKIILSISCVSCIGPSEEGSASCTAVNRRLLWVTIVCRSIISGLSSSYRWLSVTCAHIAPSVGRWAVMTCPTTHMHTSLLTSYDNVVSQGVHKLFLLSFYIYAYTASGVKWI